MPKVSVIVLSYNHEKFIAETIRSVLNQTFQDFEIIVVDDCSTDNSVAEIKKITDPRIKLFVHDKNQGTCATHNDALAKASGEYTSLINSDDTWEKNKLAAEVQYLTDHPEVDIVFTKVTLIDDFGNKLLQGLPNVFDVKNRTPAEWLHHFFTTGNCLCHPSSMPRKSVYSDVGYYQKKFGLLGDFDMWIRVSLKKHQIHILDEPLINFRILQNGQNVSAGSIYSTSRNYFEYQKALDNYLHITDIQYFEEIFPEAKIYGQVTPDTIPYFLARIALEVTSNTQNLWGLNTLYKFISDENNLKIVEERFGFTNVDFVKLTKSYDLLNLKAIEERDKITQSILNTISWKVTKPLRAIKSIFRVFQ